jgi:hypothetical protein
MIRRLAAAGILAAVSAAGADTVTKAQIEVDARDPADVSIRSTLTVRVEGGAPRGSIDLFLCRALEVVEAGSGGRPATLRAEDLPGTLLRRWTVALPAAIRSGESGDLSVEARVLPPEMPGIRVDGSGGMLLPGAGWFPQLAPETDELPVHSTTFALPAGWAGVAAGDGGGTKWTTAVPARPFAVWGAFERTRTSGAPSFDVWRRAGHTGVVPRAERLARLAGIAATGMGADAPAWKLVDVGNGLVGGGYGAVFWDEKAAALASGAAATLLERDLSEALAATFWTEQFRAVGPHAAWLARSMAAYLGDVGRIALDESDQHREAIEAAVISPRRDAFFEGLAEDRPLAGIVPVSAGGPRCLATRGALLAHMLAEAVPSRTEWILCLGEFRRAHAGATVDLATFREFVGRSFPTHHETVWPFLDTTALPRFRITDHGPAKGLHADRYRVTVANQGAIAGAIEVVSFSAQGNRLRASRLQIPPAGEKSVAFDKPESIARIMLDPRGLVLQAALQDQVVELAPRHATPAEAEIPSFEFFTRSHTGYAVRDFVLELDGVTISNFEGFVVDYSTHHGPSGAALIGQGDVTVAPGGAFAAGFERAMGTRSLTFYGAKNMWIRFPLSAWKRIEPQLDDPGEGSANEGALFHERQRIYQFMFKSYFADEQRAQVPPPGGSLAIFVTEGGEWRGIVRRPLPDGRVEMRLWDHLVNDVLWEETH